MAVIALRTAVVLCLAIGLPGKSAWAAIQFGSGYEEIVNELARSESRLPKGPETDPWSQVKIHAGVAVASTSLNVRPPEKGMTSAFLSGVQVSLGIDLFSRHWIAEGTMRSLGQMDGDAPGDSLKLKEFDLKFYYQTPFWNRLISRFGVGMAGRYLDGKINSESFYYTTPASIFFFGVDGYLSPTISIGPEISWRSALVEETGDRSAIDLSLRIDAHF